MANTVTRTPEFDRIIGLPVRPDYSAEEQKELQIEVTRMFSVRPSNPPRILHFHQALLLAELFETGTAFGGGLGVGSGKTDISYLCANHSPRPMLIVPGELKSKAAIDINELRKYWEFQTPEVVSLDSLSRMDGDEILYRYSPTIIVLDECHRFKNPSAGRTLKLSRYLESVEGTKDWPVVVPLTGTVTEDGLEDYYHLVKWASIGRHESKLARTMPIPIHPSEAFRWSEAIGSLPTRSVGVLSGLAPSHITSPYTMPLQKARVAFGWRLYSTPGFHATKEDTFKGGLIITVDKSSAAKHPHAEDIKANLDTLSKIWELPDGKKLVDAFEVQRAEEQLPLEFYYEWDPPPPPEWKAARKSWGSHVRRVLNHARETGIPLDTPYQVQQLAMEQGIEDWKRWDAIRHTYNPRTTPVWLHKGENICVTLVKKYMKSHRHAIIWVTHRAVAEMLSAELQIPSFGAKGLSAADGHLQEYRGQYAIAQIRSCGTGLNLQHNFHNNLILTPPSTGTANDQLIGRTHRQGQREKDVHVQYTILSQSYGFALTKSGWRSDYANETTSSRKFSVATWLEI